MYSKTLPPFRLVGTLAAAIVLLAAPRAMPQVLAQQNPSDITVINATNVFTQAMAMPGREIPQSLIAQAQAVAIIPNMVRGAFVFGVQHGRGVLVLRDANGSWQPPRFIQITGGSIGYQIGVQSTDLVLVFRTERSVQNLLRGTMKIGVDASAAAGPVGRQTSAATDLQLQAEILSYSRARGAFVGVSIDGSVISLDQNAEAMYYQSPGVVPASAVHLIQTLTAYAAASPAAAAAVPGAVAAAGWVPAGQTQAGPNTEVLRYQLDQSYARLTPILPDNDWRQFLAIPPEINTPNTPPSPQVLQQVTARYEQVSRDPSFANLSSRPEFQQTLQTLRQMNQVTTATNNGAISVPPPPR